jgi:hypothetical protein
VLHAVWRGSRAPRGVARLACSTRCGAARVLHAVWRGSRAPRGVTRLTCFTRWRGSCGADTERLATLLVYSPPLPRPAHHGPRAAPPDEDGAGAAGGMVDPVWGQFDPPFTPARSIGIACCPCCVPPCCSPARKAAWRRVVRSAAFILSALQVALLIVSLCFRGFAPTSLNPMLGPWPDTLDLLQAKNAAFIVYRWGEGACVSALPAWLLTPSSNAAVPLVTGCMRTEPLVTQVHAR